MQLQRSYSLPNCTLTLEGMSDPSAGPNLESSMTILVNVVCQFLGKEAPLSGGREFFTHLVNTVSHYAQEQLSGLRSRVSQEGLVRLRRLDNGLHQIAVYDAPEGQPATAGSVQTADLSTVQLFDLVEAIDQFLADGTALPDLKFSLSPLPKREVPSQVPVAQRAAAPALGVAGVAIAAAVLFGLPLPEINRPLEERLEGQGDKVEAVQADDAAAAAGAALESSPGAEDGENALAEALNPRRVITDGETLAEIQTRVQADLNEAWTQPLGVGEDLAYRVSADADGNIVGYQGLSDLAQDNADRTPLLDLLYLPPEGTRVDSEALAQLKVVFTANDQLEVTPLTAADLEQGLENGPADGDAGEPEAVAPGETEDRSLVQGGEGAGRDSAEGGSRARAVTAAGLVQTQPITDSAAIAELNQTLYRRLDEAWVEPPSFETALEYRVQLSEAGDVVGVEPLNLAARTYGDEIPLGALQRAQARPNSAAEFKAVFKANGVLEVSPWDGL